LLGLVRWKDGAIVRDYYGSATGSDRRPAAAVFLSLLDERGAAERPVSENSRAGNYAPKQFASLPSERREGYNLKQLKGAMEALFKTGDLVNEAYGRPSDMRKKIVRREVVEAAA
jgi:hypothetical protein